jgi:signal transduction histidine kinase
VIENYTNRIITSLDEKRLVHLLKEEVFPSLLIRQGSLLRLFGSGQENSPLQYQVLYKSGITNDQLPRPENIPILLEQSGKLLTAGDRPGGEELPCSWARLALPLCVESNTMGICLLGRRDPDDYYSPAEIQALQVIINQTALALVNIDQAERLRALHQYDIDRQETERNRLARDLHDDVLGQMAMLAQSLDDDRSNEKLLLAFQNSVDRMREIIDDLRPSMLNFGLRAAIDELVDELMARQKNGSENSPQIVITIPPSQERYPLEIELHMYRIVQQACYNAYKHANPKHIYLRGNLESHLVDILIQDDGDGFEITNPPDFNDLLANKHFGLAGMYERAALIRGHVNISSSPAGGTSVRVTWSDSETG